MTAVTYFASLPPLIRSSLPGPPIEYGDLAESGLALAIVNNTARPLGSMNGVMVALTLCGIGCREYFEFSALRRHAQQADRRIAVGEDDCIVGPPCDPLVSRDPPSGTDNGGPPAMVVFLSWLLRRTQPTGRRARTSPVAPDRVRSGRASAPFERRSAVATGRVPDRYTTKRHQARCRCPYLMPRKASGCRVDATRDSRVHRYASLFGLQDRRPDDAREQFAESHPRRLPPGSKATRTNGGASVPDAGRATSSST